MSKLLNIEVSDQLAEMLDTLANGQRIAPMDPLARAVTTIIRLQVKLMRLRAAAEIFEQDLGPDCDGDHRDALRAELKTA
mgnify:CR=1 FL=1